MLKAGIIIVFIVNSPLISTRIFNAVSMAPGAKSKQCLCESLLTHREASHSSFRSLGIHPGGDSDLGVKRKSWRTNSTTRWRRSMKQFSWNDPKMLSLDKWFHSSVGAVLWSSKEALMRYCFCSADMPFSRKNQIMSLATLLLISRNH